MTLEWVSLAQMTAKEPRPILCPKCGSHRTTIIGMWKSLVWLQCEECEFRFSADRPDLRESRT